MVALLYLDGGTVSFITYHAAHLVLSFDAYDMQEWDMAKTRQDKKLDEIEKGVDTLGEMARQMQDEVSG